MWTFSSFLKSFLISHQLSAIGPCQILVLTLPRGTTYWPGSHGYVPRHQCIDEAPSPPSCGVDQPGSFFVGFQIDHHVSSTRNQKHVGSLGSFSWITIEGSDTMVAWVASRSPPLQPMTIRAKGISNQLGGYLTGSRCPCSCHIHGHQWCQLLRLRHHQLLGCSHPIPYARPSPLGAWVECLWLRMVALF